MSALVTASYTATPILSDDTVNHVCIFLSVKDALALACTSRTWYADVQTVHGMSLRVHQPATLIGLCQSKFKTIVDRLNLNQCMSLLDLVHVPGATELLSNLREFYEVIGSDGPTPFVSKPITFSNKLVDLRIRFNGFARLTMWQSMVTATHLQRLAIEFGPQTRADLLVPCIASLQHLRELTVVTFRMAHSVLRSFCELKHVPSLRLRTTLDGLLNAARPAADTTTDIVAPGLIHQLPTHLRIDVRAANLHSQQHVNILVAFAPFIDRLQVEQLAPIQFIPYQDPWTTQMTRLEYLSVNNSGHIQSVSAFTHIHTLLLTCHMLLEVNDARAIASLPNLSRVAMTLETAQRLLPFLAPRLTELHIAASTLSNQDALWVQDFRLLHTLLIDSFPGKEKVRHHIPTLADLRSRAPGLTRYCVDEGFSAAEFTWE